VQETPAERPKDLEGLGGVVTLERALVRSARRPLEGLSCYAPALVSPATQPDTPDGFIPTSVHPRTRDSHLGEQGQEAPLQLRPHKRSRSHHPTLLRLAHPDGLQALEAARVPPDPETLSARATGSARLDPRGGSHLRPILWLGDYRRGCQRTQPLLRRGGAGGVFGSHLTSSAECQRFENPGIWPLRKASTNKR
jgi:hypothetical protein